MCYSSSCNGKLFLTFFVFTHAFIKTQMLRIVILQNLLSSKLFKNDFLPNFLSKNQLSRIRNTILMNCKLQHDSFRIPKYSFWKNWIWKCPVKIVVCVNFKYISHTHTHTFFITGIISIHNQTCEIFFYSLYKEWRNSLE